ncbi:MAG: OmpA family protein [Sphingobacteriaceae bacterium]|nr:OmpA family protein [Sphingobacteriaceae bacterium]
MKKKQVRSFFFLIGMTLCFQNYAQVKIDTLRFYFEINEKESAKHAARIDSFIQNSFGRVYNFSIHGYADFLHNSDYNNQLSVARAEGIKSYLTQKIPPVQINSIAVKGFGEGMSKDNGTKTGDQFNRRVDVILEPFVIKHEEINEPPVDTVVEEEHHEEIYNKLEKGESLAIEGLNFIPGRHFIVKSSIPILTKLLSTMKKNPNLKVEIQGHICCLKEKGDGLDMDTGIKNLSQSRAKAVYDFLVHNGIDKDRLSYKGFGHTKPKISPEVTPADEQMNRRVEVLIIDK